jgi:DNA replication initiation complex subunit (GINS family)
MSLTYEQLFDYLREERGNTQLQTLSSSFYTEVATYLDIKEQSAKSLEDQGSLTAESAFDQLKNAKKLITDIFQRREKKVIALALNKSRTQSQLIDTSALLPDESEFFEELLSIFDAYRKDLLTSVLTKTYSGSSLPGLGAQMEGEVDISRKSEPISAVSEPLATSGAPIEETPSEPISGVPAETVKVKFLQYVDKFVGPDLDILGPFEEGDYVDLPATVVDVVVSKGYAERA